MARKSKPKRRQRGVADCHHGELTRRPWAPVSPSSPFIDETLAFWQPRSKRSLTREDAREIIQNVVGFFSILDEWDRAEREVLQNQETASSLGKADNANAAIIHASERF